jgi:hypothetical protein
VVRLVAGEEFLAAEYGLAYKMVRAIVSTVTLKINTYLPIIPFGAHEDHHDLFTMRVTRLVLEDLDFS